MIDVTVPGVIQIIITSLIGMYAVSGALGGYFQYYAHWYERVILLFSGLMMIYPEIITDIVGFIIILAIGILQIRRKKKQAQFDILIILIIFHQELLN